MGGQDHCCIVNCTNRRSSMPKGFAFHRIPAVPITRRNAWIKASGRQLGKKIGELTVTEHTKVCGAHFTTGRKSKDPTHIDYVPTLNLPIQSKSTPQRFTTRSRRAMEYEFAISEATLVKKKTFAKSGKVLFPIDINDVQHEVVIESESACTRNVEHLTNTVRENCEVTPIDHDYHRYWIDPIDNYKESSSQTCNENTDNFSQTIPDTSRTVTASIQTETESSTKSIQVDTFSGHVTNLTDIKMKQQSRLLSEMKSKVKVLTKENDLLQRQTFCAENMLISDGNVLFYTGLPNIITFKALLSYLEPKAKRLTYWEGCDTTRRSHFTKGPSRKLNIENELFAVLVRLKLGLLVEDIASRFKISCAQFSKMFNTWIRFLSIELDHLFPYPSMEQVRALMPESFNRFPNTRIILDCTEIFIQKPSALKAQRQTWSSYKHRNTYKALIGITPDGTVSFVSSLYGGAASDKFIINDCGILDYIMYIEPGDNVMADRGFEIADELSKKGASLNIPPFRNGNFQLSAQQVEVTRRIAEVRIHVERAIQRIKTFHILDGTMPLSLQIVADEIFRTCSFLTNFQTPIIKC